MAVQFPTLSCGSPAKYPLVRSRIQRSQVLTFVNFSEQRFAKGTPLETFELRWTKVPTKDKDLVRDFWNSVKGTFDTTWTLELVDEEGDTLTYNHLQFTPGQQFEATEESTNLWSFALTVRKTRKD